MDLNALKSQLDTTEGQLGQYTANLPSEIETQIQGAYTPLLERSLGVTKDLMGDYLGRFMETTGMGPGMQGTTAYDLSPTQRMGVIGRELGNMGGQLNSSVAYSDYLGGQMNDTYGKALQAAQMGQQNLADQYNRQFQQYQLAWQAAEAEKDRQAQIRAAEIGAYRPTEQTYQDDLVIDTEDGNVDKTGNKNWTNTVKQTGSTKNIFTGVPTMVGNLIGNTMVPKPGKPLTFIEKLLNQRSNNGSGSMGGGW